MAGGVVAAAVVALVGGSLLTNQRPSPTGPVAIGSPSTRPSQAPTPGPTEAPWADLELPPYEPLAELVPSDRDRLGVANTATFEVRAKNGASAAELAGGLTVTPAIQFSIEPGADASRAIIRPARALEPGTRYRWVLTATDGSLAGSWLFTVRQPLHVVTTLPGDHAVDVPPNTGIEVTFDQDGTTGVSDHITIEPAVAGRFEQHGRTWAFVPGNPLAERTIYSVTVKAGVGASGSTEKLETDVSFQFETGTALKTPPRIDFERSILEVRPGVQPVVLLSTRSFDEEGEVPLPTGPYTIDAYRLPSFDAAADAARRLAGAIGWAIASPDAVVATAGLTRVERVSATAIQGGSGGIVPLPMTLTAGWYVLQIDQPTGPAQMLLQVTNVAAYALVSTETLLVWVNDLASGAVVPNAKVRLLSGKQLGTTVANGTLKAPAAEVEVAPQPGYEAWSTAAAFLEVRAPDGRAVIVALGLRSAWGYEGFGYGFGGSAGAKYWTLFRTDRETYRPTDSIHMSGLLRSRADRSVPSDVSVQLLPADGDSDVPIATVPVSLSSRGTFIADVQLKDLPRTGYRLQLLVGSTAVSSVWVYVAEIRKPAYQIDVTTDRRAYVVGEPVEVSARVTFYDGTAAPGLDLQLEAFGKVLQRTTDAGGRIQASLIAGYGENDSEGYGVTDVSVRPLRPEEGQISGATDVLLLPSRVWAKGAGVVDGGRVTVDGNLSWADLAALHAARARGEYPDDGAGVPIAGRALTIEITRYVERRTQTGTRYDYIEKKVVPEYDTDFDEVAVGRYPATSDSRGAFHVSVAVPSSTDRYDARITAKDPEGREFAMTLFLYPTDQGPTIERRPYIVDAGFCGGSPSLTVGLGEQVDATMRAGDGSVASGGRFLYLISRQGSLDVSVQDAAAFRPVFRDGDLPSFNVVGVWQTDKGFATASALARVDVADKQIAVSVKPDAGRYQPGDTVTVRVTTTGPDGDPIAADVILQGVDQKLYTLGQAFDVDPARELFSPVDSGIVLSSSTHVSPFESADGCGDEGGGGEGRNDFRDAVTFQRITTNASGQGSATFRLSDDLTSWHLTATAAASNLDVGQVSVLIPVGLDFFAEPALAPVYLAGDQPVFRVRSYGDALAAGDTVRFVVTSPALQLNATVTGTAFQAVSIPLPRLVAGRYPITIAAEATHGGRILRDTLTRTINVVPSRLTALTTSVDELTAGFSPRGGGPGMTTYVITDAGRGSLISLLEELAASTSARFDTAAAADVARSILIGEFGLDPDSLPTSGYDADRYQQGGVALLPYAGVDLELSALAALTAPTRLSSGAMADWLRDGATLGTRERDLLALVALAGLGQDVAADLQALDPAALTIREQLWLALGLAAVGDDGGARAIERALLDAHGQRLGRWVRLQAGTSREDSLEASGLLLVLAGRLGDALAADVARYLVDQPSKEHVFPLQLVTYAESALQRLPRAAGKFAYTIDGTRREVALAAGGSFTLTLIPSEVASLRLETLEGKLDVVTSWQTTDVPTTNSPHVTVTRTVTPDVGSVDGKLVRVTLTVGFGPQAPRGCYVLTDLLPSGLAPVTTTAGWESEDENGNRVVGPYEVDGQRVSWCVSPGQPSLPYGYSARVVSPGAYRWEPAVIQSLDAPEVRSATEETAFTIR